MEVYENNIKLNSKSNTMYDFYEVEKMEAINIAQNDKTIFISIEKEKINKTLLSKLNKLLNNDFISSGIEYVDDTEQKELENILEAMTSDDKEIAYTSRVTFD